MVVQAGFAQSDYLGGGGKGGQLFKMVVGYVGGIVWAKTHGGEKLRVTAGELDGGGGIFEALAYGEQAGQASAAGAVENGRDILAQLGKGEMAVGISEARYMQVRISYHRGPQLQIVCWLAPGG